MMVELEERVSQLESWTDGKGVIVRGADGTFCSGSDLTAVRAISNPQVAASLQQGFSKHFSGQGRTFSTDLLIAAARINASYHYSSMPLELLRSPVKGGLFKGPRIPAVL